MSASSPETSISSSSSKDDEELWEETPPPSISRLNSLDCWDYSIELECLRGPEDLQLAAELGKTLLERNKELEGSLKHQQNVIDDQLQEIEYLTKQTTALREVNDSRLRIYENLEVSILDLERGNHILSAENASYKKQNKTLANTTETLEERCEELNKQIEELNKQYENERRKNERILQAEKNKNKEELKRVELRHVNDASFTSDTENYQPLNNSENISFAFRPPDLHSSNSLTSSSLNGDVLDGSTDEYGQSHMERSEELIKIVSELDMTKRQCFNEQQRVSELEEQLNSLLRENHTLQSRLAQTSTTEEIKSMHEELSVLDEVRHGKMCTRCLRNVDIDEEMKMNEDDVSIVDTEDGDDSSLYGMSNDEMAGHTYRSAVTIKIDPKLDTSLKETSPSPNIYRDLVDKYEALLEIKRQPCTRQQQHQQQPNNQCVEPNNLFDELNSGDFSSINTNKETYEGKNRAETAAGGVIRKTSLRTPTDFSEAETSSSGFSDETSNKCTQTDETFLCTIADGEDKFSIYDDALPPFDVRFRDRPEYRDLFKEIFAILKKAAENKDEGEKLPLLDDANPCFKVPPVTPAVEDLPSFPDETESVISSVVSEHSVAMSERITKQERKVILDTVKKHAEKNGQENKPPTGKQILEDGRVLTPFKRQPLEYLAVSVNIRKKNRRKSKNQSFDRSDSPVLPSPPRIYYQSSGKKRKDLRSSSIMSNFTNAHNRSATSTDAQGVWNGSSMTIYNRNIQSPSPSGSANTSLNKSSTSSPSTNPPEFRRASAASQNLHQLMKLDLSYAEVLRRGDVKNAHHNRYKK